MKVYTSNYRLYYGTNGVQISRTRPIYSVIYKKIESLYPTKKESLLISSGDVSVYRDRISQDINSIISCLDEGDVLLCWCRSGEMCHRHIVSELLSKAGVQVEEYKL